MENRTWIEERTPGRRDTDRSVCVWHAQRDEAVAEIKQSTIDDLRRIEDSMKLKLDTGIFKIFVASSVSILIFVGGWVGYNVSRGTDAQLKAVEIATRLDTNQKHMMEEFNIKPLE